MATLRINGQTMDIGDIDPSTPLLWALRDTLGLVGTKYGCGIAQCGACTVHLNGAPMRVMCSVEFTGSTPATTAAPASPPCGICAGAQTSILPSLNSAVVVSGSSCACET